MTQPIDYKAEARGFLAAWRSKGLPDEALAALLERLCGEAREAEEAETLIWRKLVDDLRQQLAAAQKEIERLQAEVQFCRDMARDEETARKKAESAIEQAREEGFRECDGQWQMAIGFAVTGMEREKAVAQVREEGWKAGMAEGQSIAFDRGKEEGRREQREIDEAICGNAADQFSLPRVKDISAFDAAMVCKDAIREAKP